uniref:Putative rna lariat debranching enzyme n=1 Tax=Panstrongylus megistus TaxID=65343 RepID=A0A069DVC4_9HEMI
MKIAVEGCAHGELEKIYDSIEFLEKKGGFKVDLLICCGDFQATRNIEDLKALAAPAKYRELCTFYKYYSGEKTAPLLTIFIGGNHEASNYLQELPYGGWVAPNIYYLGNAGIINVAGVRIGGISGIFKERDYYKGRFEKPPYSEQTKRSVYHIRSLDVFRFKQVNGSIDIFLSHDWPRGIHKYGNYHQLLKLKPFFSEDINENKLGSPPCEDLLHLLKPKFWFAAHMHCKFVGIVPHKDDQKVTKFLALDKCLPKRKFLQIINVDHDAEKPIEIKYDLEWLCILHYTNHLISIDSSMVYMPGPGCDERWIFTPTKDEKEFIFEKMSGDLRVPLNFAPTAPTQEELQSTPKKRRSVAPLLNSQTIEFCEKLGIDDPLALILEKTDNSNSATQTLNNSSPALDTSENSASFVDSEISGILSGSDDLDASAGVGDSDKEAAAPSPVPKNRLSMTLPPPKFSPSYREDSSFEINNSDPLSGEDSPLFIIDEGPKRSVSNEELQDDQPKKETTIQGIKKFKRRNELIYKQTVDD